MTPLFHTHHRPSIPQALQAGWLERREELAHRLVRYPEAEWAWLWRMRLRVFNYLISRYGTGDAPVRRDVAAPVARFKEPPPREPAPSAPVPKRTIDETPADQLQVRNAARQRCSAFLAGRGTLSKDIQLRADAAWRREVAVDRWRSQVLYFIGFVALVGYLSVITSTGLFLLALYGIQGSPATAYFPDAYPVALIISAILFVAAGILFLRRRALNSRARAGDNCGEGAAR